MGNPTHDLHMSLGVNSGKDVSHYHNEVSKEIDDDFQF
jgi:hypothetical protein